jgi:hypothetical protein
MIEMHREVAETLREIKTGAERLLELLHQMGSPIYARNRLEMMLQVIEETTEVMIAAMTRDCPDEDPIEVYQFTLVKQARGEGPESELKKLDFETDYICNLLERFVCRTGLIPLDDEEEGELDELAEALRAKNSRLIDRFAALCVKSPTNDSTSNAGPGASTGMPES